MDLQGNMQAARDSGSPAGPSESSTWTALLALHEGARGMPVDPTGGRPVASGDLVAWMPGRTPEKAEGGDVYRRESPARGERTAQADPAPSRGGGGVDHIVEKENGRLAQNREAARRFRQKRKAYVRQLEEELAMLKQQDSPAGEGRDAGAGGRAGAAGSGKGEDWGWGGGEEAGGAREAHEEAVAAVASALASGAPDSVLSPLVDACLEGWWEMHRTMQTALDRTGVLTVLADGFSVPAFRWFLWFGGFKPTELLSNLVEKLRCDKNDEALLATLEKRRQQLLEHQAAVEKSYDLLKDALLERLTGFPCLREAGQGADMASMQEGGWIRSEGVMTQQLLGKLQGLVALFGQADELRVNLFNDLYTMLDTRNRAILAVTASMAWLQLEAILPPYNHGVADAVL